MHQKPRICSETAAERPKARQPKRKTAPIPRVPTSDDVKNCTTSEELAKLIESAFATWGDPNARRSEDKRNTPRIQLENAKKLLLVSYTHERKQQHVGVRADLVDISADGLGIIVAKPIPLGATVRFALADDNGEPVFGYACVARTTRRSKKHWVGLTFMDRMESLDIDESTDKEKDPAAHPSTWSRIFEQIRRRACFAVRRIFSGYRTIRTVTRCDRGKRASFRIEAKLLRYQAALDVDGVRVAFASWPLDGRSQKQSCSDPQCTVVQLEGGGFRATATLQPGTILSCELETGGQASRQRFLVAPQHDTAPLNIELGPPRNEAPEQVVSRKTSAPPHRR